MDELYEATITCPYCGETIELLVDLSAGAQRYVEDCRVCCRPIAVRAEVDRDGAPIVEAHAEDD